MLRDRSVTEPRARLRDSVPRLSLTQALVVAQIAISLLLLVAAGLFVRTLSNLQSIPLGFNRDRVLLFELNAPQAGYPEARVADFYADLRRRLSEIPGVRDATLSHASLIRAGRSHPITVNGVPTQGTRVLLTGPRFFTTMQIPLCGGGRSRKPIARERCPSQWSATSSPGRTSATRTRLADTSRSAAA